MASSIKVILSEDVSKLGEAGELVNVKPGYARNFLVPQGKATFATESRVKELEHHRRVISDKLAKQLKDVKALNHKLKSIVVEVKRRAGEDGKLFGSVTSQNIADLIAEKGYELDRRKIQLPDSIKEIGEHQVEIKLHPDVMSAVKVVVSLEE
jgi:large subunit ribosomal protein L9